jgi:hypothetical protein
MATPLAIVLPTVTVLIYSINLHKVWQPNRVQTANAEVYYGSMQFKPWQKSLADWLQLWKLESNFFMFISVVVTQAHPKFDISAFITATDGMDRPASWQSHEGKFLSSIAHSVRFGVNGSAY